MYHTIRTYCEEELKRLHLIPEERKSRLDELAGYLTDKLGEDKTVNLIFICTHNSRRSHFGQIWAGVAAACFELENIRTFSGGTEATAFHTNAIRALSRVGFSIQAQTNEFNPVYAVRFSDALAPLTCFSKIYDHPQNPQDHFIAVMTCGEAEQNCPFIPGAEKRIAITYEDPKVSDGTPRQDETYDERCRQIAREMLYLFSKVKA
jgi:arsenate reductase (thioredoxin)